MGKSPANIDDYLQDIPEASRTIISTVRRMIMRAATAIEAIKYGMPTATLDGTNIIYYAAWKKHIGLDPIYAGGAGFEQMIAPYRTKKDTVRFLLDEPILFEIIDLILTTRVDSLKNLPT